MELNTDSEKESVDVSDEKVLDEFNFSNENVEDQNSNEKNATKSRFSTINWRKKDKNK